MESSFFDKLKKGMDVEGEKKEEEIKEIPIEIEDEKNVEEEKEEKKLKKQMKKKSPVKAEEKEQEEGQLAVDVYQTESDLIIQSAIAGVTPDELDISVESDLISIKGERRRPGEENEDFFSRECYWGPFSRKIILPVEVDAGRIEATLKEGILTIRMPKLSKEKKRKVTVKKL